MTDYRDEIIRILQDGFCYSTYNPNGKYFNMSFCVKTKEDFDLIFQTCINNTNNVILQCTIRQEANNEQEN